MGNRPSSDNKGDEGGAMAKDMQEFVLLPYAKPRPSDMKVVFDALDPNQEGLASLDQVEYVASLVLQGANPVVRTEVLKSLRAVSLGNDGQISFEEFAGWWDAHIGNHAQEGKSVVDLLKMKLFDQENELERLRDEARETSRSTRTIGSRPKSAGSSRYGQNDSGSHGDIGQGTVDTLESNSVDDDDSEVLRLENDSLRDEVEDLRRQLVMEQGNVRRLHRSNEALQSSLDRLMAAGDDGAGAGGSTKVAELLKKMKDLDEAHVAEITKLREHYNRVIAEKDEVIAEHGDSRAEVSRLEESLRLCQMEAMELRLEMKHNGLEPITPLAGTNNDQPPSHRRNTSTISGVGSSISVPQGSPGEMNLEAKRRIEDLERTLAELREDNSLLRSERESLKAKAEAGNSAAEATNATMQRTLSEHQERLAEAQRDLAVAEAEKKVVMSSQERLERQVSEETESRAKAEARVSALESQVADLEKRLERAESESRSAPVIAVAAAAPTQSSEEPQRTPREIELEAQLRGTEASISAVIQLKEKEANERVAAAEKISEDSQRRVEELERELESERKARVAWESEKAESAAPPPTEPADKEAAVIDRTAEVEELQAELAAARKELDSAKKSLEEAEANRKAESVEGSDAIAERDKRIEALTGEVKSLTSDNEDLREKLRAADSVGAVASQGEGTRVTETNDSEIARLTDECARLREQLEASNQELEELKGEAEQRTAPADPAPADETAASKGDDRAADREQEMEAARQRIAELEERLESAEGEAARLKETEAALQTAEDERDSLVERVASLKSDLDAMKQAEAGEALPKDKVADTALQRAVMMQRRYTQERSKGRSMPLDGNPYRYAPCADVGDPGESEGKATDNGETASDAGSVKGKAPAEGAGVTIDSAEMALIEGISTLRGSEKTILCLSLALLPQRADGFIRLIMDRLQANYKAGVVSGVHHGLTRRFYSVLKNTLNSRQCRDIDRLSHDVHMLADVERKFTDEALLYGKLIISELRTPIVDRLIPPVDAYGNEYIVRGIRFYVASEAEQEFPCAAPLSTKRLANGLRAAIHIGESGLTDICVPLQLMIDYKGHRILAVAEPAHVEFFAGSEDGGLTHSYPTPDSNDERAQLLRRADQLGRVLNLRAHSIGSDKFQGMSLLPSNTGLYLDRDSSNIYVLGLDRMIPPTATDLPTQAQAPSYTGHLTRVMRPEYLMKYGHQLSSDVFCPMGGPADERRPLEEAVIQASEGLVKETIPKCAATLDKFMTGSFGAILHSVLAQRIHLMGVNMRYLGLIRKHSKETRLRGVLLVEMIARCIKCDLRQRLAVAGQLVPAQASPPRRASSSLTQTGQLDQTFVSDRAYKKIISEYFTFLLARGKSSDEFWALTIKHMVELKFPGCLFPAEMKGNVNFRVNEAYWLNIIFRKVTSALGIVMSDGFYNAVKTGLLHVEEADVLEVSPRVRQPGIVPHINGDSYLQKAFAMHKKGTLPDVRRLLEAAVAKYVVAINSMPSNRTVLIKLGNTLVELGMLDISYLANPSDPAKIPEALQNAREELLQGSYYFDCANVIQKLQQKERHSRHSVANFALRGRRLGPMVASIVGSLMNLTVALTTVDLSGHRIEASGCTHIAERLPQSSVENLDMSDNIIGEAGCRILGPAIGESMALTALNLNENDIGDAGMKALVDGGLVRNNRLESLCLQSNGLESEGCTSLIVFLQVARRLRILDLCDNRIGNVGFKRLCNVITNLPCLEVLNVAKNNISAEGMDRVMGFLGGTSTLKALVVRENPLGDQGVITLSLGLCKNKTIQTLDLTSVGMKNKGGQAIVEVLKNLSKMEYLEISMNNLGSPCAAMIFGIIRSHPKLHTLHASRIGMDHGAVIALTDMMKRTRSLRVLNVRQNDFKKESAVLLADALTVNTSIQSLNLGGGPGVMCRIGDEGVLVMAECLKRNRTLSDLSLYGQSVGRRAAMAIAEMLVTRALPFTLDLEKNDIGEEAEKLLVEVDTAVENIKIKLGGSATPRRPTRLPSNGTSVTQ